MRPTQALEFVKLDYCSDDDCNHSLCQRARAGRDVLLAVFRRDWAVRVLDAWAANSGITCWRMITRLSDNEELPDVFACHLGFGEPDWSDNLRCTFVADTNAAAARLAAAEAVWPELPESVRAELGERP